MATSVISTTVQVDSKQAEQAVGSIKSRLKEARTELTNAIENFGEFSTEAVNAAKKVEGLKGTIDDASRLVSAFDGDRKFEAFGKSVGAVASGFTAAQGAIGLFGTESKEVEAALLKVNSAMALSQGINGVMDGIKSFKDLGNQLKGTIVFQKASAAATVVATTVQKVFTGSVDATSKGFKLLKGAIIATGIGALVVLLGLVINNFDSIKKVIEKLLGPLKGVTDFIGKLVTGFTDFIGITSEADRTTEKLKKSIVKNNEALNNQIEIMQAQGATSKEIRAVKNKMYEDELNNIRAVLAAQGKLSEEEAARFRELKQQQAVLAAEQGKEDKDAAAAEAAKKAEAANKAAEAARQRAATAAADRKRERERIAAEQAKALEDERKRIEDLNAKRISDTRAFVKAERQEVKDGLEKTTQASNERLLARVTQSIEIRGKDIKDKEQKTADQIALEKGLSDLQLQADQKRIGSIQAVSNALGVASDIIGKETAAGKALAVSQALINTYLGASEVIKAKSTLPEPFGTIAKIANVAAIIATGLKSVKAITSVKVPGGGGGGGGANIPSSLVTAPVAPQAESTRLDQTQINQIGNAASRAFVVESDITGNQDKIKRLNRQARIN
jgi:hypothetical protein